MEVEIQEDLLAQEEIAAMHPRSAEIRDRSYLVPVFLSYSLILLGNTRYGGWILEDTPTRDTPVDNGCGP
jgi:hypothetical protein